MDRQLMNHQLSKITQETLVAFLRDESVAKDDPEQFGAQIAEALEKAYKAGAEANAKK